MVGLPCASPEALVAVPSHVPLDLFTDGSCFWPKDGWRVAAWSICMTSPSRNWPAFDSQILGTGCVPGLVQTAFRAELFELCVALSYGVKTCGPVTI